jgi:hypothetical protein
VQKLLIHFAFGLLGISSGAKISDHFSWASRLDKTLEMKRLLI